MNDLYLSNVHDWYLIIKRVFDILMALFALIFALPLFLFIAILIKLNSSGPVLFKQERIGKKGKPFTIYKFRSMRVDSDIGLHYEHITRLINENIKPEQLDGKMGRTLKIKEDPRITHTGNILRRTSLDELPQLFNVLRGEMSLVGPRPPLPYEVEVYKEWHKRRLEVLPGITGLWQVRARNQVSFDEMVKIDIEYIENQSLWLDLKIILETPRALINARGAG